MMRWHYGILLGILGFNTPSAVAAIIASYPLDTGTTTTGTINTTPLTAPTVDTHPTSTAGIFTTNLVLTNDSGQGMTASTSSTGGGSVYARVGTTAANGTPGTSTIPGTETDAIAGNSYFTFSVSPNSGYALNLSNLTFQSDTNHSGNAFTGTVFVRSSVDGFTATLASYAELSTTGTSFNNRNVSLTDSAFQNLINPVEFRFYVYDDSAAATSNATVLRLDTFVLNGDTVAVPEPSVYLLGALGLAGWMASYRRFA